jgi:hypothetical protein
VNATQLHQAIMELPCKVQPEDFSAALELVLAAGLPQWREKPTEPGLYFTKHDLNHSCEFTENDMDWDGGLLYGPLPLPPEGEER